MMQKVGGWLGKLKAHQAALLLSKVLPKTFPTGSVWSEGIFLVGRGKRDQCLTFTKLVG